MTVQFGVIEGFFGRPWDWSARLSGVEFLRDLGYQFYIYAPKADPFLRRRWREPMPEETLQHLSELSLRGTANGISIGVGLTPFEIYLNYECGRSMKQAPTCSAFYSTTCAATSTNCLGFRPT